MVTKLGIIKIPKELVKIIKEKADADSNKQGTNELSSIENTITNQKSFLIEFDRLVDPVIISMFYGLYVCKELPPEELKLASDEYEDYEFNVDIEEYKNIFNNLLFCVWAHKNGYPKSTTDLKKYRQELYKFLIKILDNDFFKKVIIPFYTKKAGESKSSFLLRMKGSGFAAYRENEMTISTPEFLFKEFKDKQKGFWQEVIKPLKSKS